MADDKNPTPPGRDPSSGQSTPGRASQTSQDILQNAIRKRSATEFAMPQPEYGLNIQKSQYETEGVRQYGSNLRTKYIDEEAPFVDTNVAAAKFENQGTLGRLFNGIARLPFKVAMGVGEQASYGLDPRNWMSLLDLSFDVHENQASRFFKSAGDAINEAMPVYTNPEDEWDWDSAGFWINTLSEGVESVAEFIAVGELGVIAGVGKVGATMQAAKLDKIRKSINTIKDVSKLEKALKGVNRSKRAFNRVNRWGRVLETGVSASVLNGIGTKHSVEMMLHGQINPETGRLYNQKEIDKISGASAAITYQNALLSNILLNGTLNMAMTKITPKMPKNSVRGSSEGTKEYLNRMKELMKNPDKWETAKGGFLRLRQMRNYLNKNADKLAQSSNKFASAAGKLGKAATGKTGGNMLFEIAQEATEEYLEGVAQLYGENYAKEKMYKRQQDVNYLSEELLGSAVIGGILGGGTSLFIGAMNKNKEADSEEQIEEMFKNKIAAVERQIKLQDTLEEALQRGDVDAAKEAEDGLFVEAMINVIDSEEAGDYIAQMEEIENMTKEEAEQKGYLSSEQGDYGASAYKDYRAIAKASKEALMKARGDYKNILADPSIPNEFKLEVARQRFRERLLGERVKIIEEQLNEHQSERGNESSSNVVREFKAQAIALQRKLFGEELDGLDLEPDERAKQMKKLEEQLDEKTDEDYAKMFEEFAKRQAEIDALKSILSNNFTNLGDSASNKEIQNEIDEKQKELNKQISSFLGGSQSSINAAEQIGESKLRGTHYYEDKVSYEQLHREKAKYEASVRKGLLYNENGYYDTVTAMRESTEEIAKAKEQLQAKMQARAINMINGGDPTQMESEIVEIEETIKSLEKKIIEQMETTGMDIPGVNTFEELQNEMYGAALMGMFGAYQSVETLEQALKNEESGLNPDGEAYVDNEEGADGNKRIFTETIDNNEKRKYILDENGEKRYLDAIVEKMNKFYEEFAKSYLVDLFSKDDQVEQRKSNKTIFNHAKQFMKDYRSGELEEKRKENERYLEEFINKYYSKDTDDDVTTLLKDNRGGSGFLRRVISETNLGRISINGLYGFSSHEALVDYYANSFRHTNTVMPEQRLQIEDIEAFIREIESAYANAREANEKYLEKMLSIFSKRNKEFDRFVSDYIKQHNSELSQRLKNVSDSSEQFEKEKLTKKNVFEHLTKTGLFQSRSKDARGRINGYSLNSIDVFNDVSDIKLKNELRQMFNDPIEQEQAVKNLVSFLIKSSNKVNSAFTGLTVKEVFANDEMMQDQLERTGATPHVEVMYDGQYGVLRQRRKGRKPTLQTQGAQGYSTEEQAAEIAELFRETSNAKTQQLFGAVYKFLENEEQINNSINSVVNIIKDIANDEPKLINRIATLLKLDVSGLGNSETDVEFLTTYIMTASKEEVDKLINQFIDQSREVELNNPQSSMGIDMLVDSMDVLMDMIGDVNNSPMLMELESLITGNDAKQKELKESIFFNNRVVEIFNAVTNEQADFDNLSDKEKFQLLTNRFELIRKSIAEQNAKEAENKNIANYYSRLRKQSMAEAKGKKNISEKKPVTGSIKQRVQKLIDNGTIVEKNGYKFMRHNQGRTVIVVNVNGIELPFYQTRSQTGGKTTNWTPFFGGGNSWLIKASVEQINNGYGIKEIQEVMEYLNENLPEYLSGVEGVFSKEELDVIHSPSDSKRVGSLQAGGNKNLFPDIMLDIDEVAKALSNLPVLDYEINEIPTYSNDPKALPFVERMLKQIRDAFNEKNQAASKLNKNSTVYEFIPFVNDKDGNRELSTDAKEIKNLDPSKKANMDDLYVTNDNSFSHFQLNYTDEGNISLRLGQNEISLSSAGIFGMLNMLKNSATTDELRLPAFAVDGTPTIYTVKNKALKKELEGQLLSYLMTVENILGEPQTSAIRQAIIETKGGPVKIELDLSNGIEKMQVKRIWENNPEKKTIYVESAEAFMNGEINGGENSIAIYNGVIDIIGKLNTEIKNILNIRNYVANTSSNATKTNDDGTIAGQGQRTADEQASFEARKKSYQELVREIREQSKKNQTQGTTQVKLRQLSEYALYLDHRREAALSLHGQNRISEANTIAAEIKQLHKQFFDNKNTRENLASLLESDFLTDDVKNELKEMISYVEKAYKILQELQYNKPKEQEIKLEGKTETNDESGKEETLKGQANEEGDNKPTVEEEGAVESGAPKRTANQKKHYDEGQYTPPKENADTPFSEIIKNATEDSDLNKALERNDWPLSLSFITHFTKEVVNGKERAIPNISVATNKEGELVIDAISKNGGWEYLKNRAVSLPNNPTMNSDTHYIEFALGRNTKWWKEHKAKMGNNPDKYYEQIPIYMIARNKQNPDEDYAVLGVVQTSSGMEKERGEANNKLRLAIYNHLENEGKRVVASFDKAFNMNTVRNGMDTNNVLNVFHQLSSPDEKGSTAQHLFFPVLGNSDSTTRGVNSLDSIWHLENGKPSNRPQRENIIFGITTGLKAGRNIPGTELNSDGIGVTFENLLDSNLSNSDQNILEKELNEHFKDIQQQYGQVGNFTEGQVFTYTLDPEGKVRLVPLSTANVTESAYKDFLLNPLSTLNRDGVTIDEYEKVKALIEQVIPTSQQYRPNSPETFFELDFIPQKEGGKGNVIMRYYSKENNAVIMIPVTDGQGPFQGQGSLLGSIQRKGLNANDHLVPAITQKYDKGSGNFSNKSGVTKTKLSVLKEMMTTKKKMQINRDLINTSSPFVLKKPVTGTTETYANYNAFISGMETTSGDENYFRRMAAVETNPTTSSMLRHNYLVTGNTIYTNTSILPKELKFTNSPYSKKTKTDGNDEPKTIKVKKTRMVKVEGSGDGGVKIEGISFVPPAKLVGTEGFKNDYSNKAFDSFTVDYNQAFKKQGAATENQASKNYAAVMHEFAAKMPSFIGEDPMNESPSKLIKNKVIPAILYSALERSKLIDSEDGALRLYTNKSQYKVYDYKPKNILHYKYEDGVHKIYFENTESFNKLFPKNSKEQAILIHTIASYLDIHNINFKENSGNNTRFSPYIKNNIKFFIGKNWYGKEDASKLMNDFGVAEGMQLGDGEFVEEEYFVEEPNPKYKGGEESTEIKTEQDLERGQSGVTITGGKGVLEGDEESYKETMTTKNAPNKVMSKLLKKFPLNKEGNFDKIKSIIDKAYNSTKPIADVVNNDTFINALKRVTGGDMKAFHERLLDKYNEIKSAYENDNSLEVQNNIPKWTKDDPEFWKVATKAKDGPQQIIVPNKVMANGGGNVVYTITNKSLLKKLGYDASVQRAKIQLIRLSNNGTRLDLERRMVFEKTTVDELESKLFELSNTLEHEDGDSDSPYYIGTDAAGNKKRYLRVSNALKGNVSTVTLPMQIAFNYGNAVDTIARDIFDGKQINTKELMTQEVEGTVVLNKVGLEQKALYGELLSESAIEKLKEYFGEIRKKMLANGERIIAKDLRVKLDRAKTGAKGDMPIAGTVDLVTIGKDGKIHLYDFKTMRKWPSEKDYQKNKINDWSRQLHAYAEAIYDEIGIYPSTTNIISAELGYKSVNKANRTEALQNIEPISGDNVKFENRDLNDEVKAQKIKGITGKAKNKASFNKEIWKERGKNRHSDGFTIVSVNTNNDTPLEKDFTINEEFGPIAFAQDNPSSNRIPLVNKKSIKLSEGVFAQKKESNPGEKIAYSYLSQSEGSESNAVREFKIVMQADTNENNNQLVSSKETFLSENEMGYLNKLIQIYNNNKGNIKSIIDARQLINDIISNADAQSGIMLAIQESPLSQSEFVDKLADTLYNRQSDSDRITASRFQSTLSISGDKYSVMLQGYSIALVVTKDGTIKGFKSTNPEKPDTIHNILSTTQNATVTSLLSKSKDGETINVDFTDVQNGDRVAVITVSSKEQLEQLLTVKEAFAKKVIATGVDATTSPALFPATAMTMVVAEHNSTADKEPASTEGDAKEKMNQEKKDSPLEETEDQRLIRERKEKLMKENEEGAKDKDDSTPQVDSSFLTGGFGGSNSIFSLQNKTTSEEEAVPSESIDIDKAAEWLQARGLPFDKAKQVRSTVERVGGRKVNGFFHKNLIHLFENAEKGTEFHEAFHAVFRLYTTESSRNKIIAAAKEIYRPPSKEELSNLSKRYPNLSKKQIENLAYEEIMADKFKAYMLGDRAPRKKNTLWNRIKNFFQSILEYIGIYKNYRRQIDDYYKNIETTDFSKENQILRNTPGDDIMYSLSDEFSPEESYRIGNILGQKFTSIYHNMKLESSLEGKNVPINTHRIAEAVKYEVTKNVYENLMFFNTTLLDEYVHGNEQDKYQKLTSILNDNIKLLPKNLTIVGKDGEAYENAAEVVMENGGAALLENSARVASILDKALLKKINETGNAEEVLTMNEILDIVDGQVNAITNKIKNDGNKTTGDLAVALIVLNAYPDMLISGLATPIGISSTAIENHLRKILPVGKDHRGIIDKLIRQIKETKRGLAVINNWKSKNTTDLTYGDKGFAALMVESARRTGLKIRYSEDIEDVRSEDEKIYSKDFTESDPSDKLTGPTKVMLRAIPVRDINGNVRKLFGMDEYHSFERVKQAVNNALHLNKPLTNVTQILSRLKNDDNPIANDVYEKLKKIAASDNKEFHAIFENFMVFMNLNEYHFTGMEVDARTYFPEGNKVQYGQGRKFSVNTNSLVKRLATVWKQNAVQPVSADELYNINKNNKSKVEIKRIYVKDRDTGDIHVSFKRAKKAAEAAARIEAYGIIKGPKAKEGGVNIYATLDGHLKSIKPIENESKYFKTVYAAQFTNNKFKYGSNSVNMESAAWTSDGKDGKVYRMTDLINDMILLAESFGIDVTPDQMRKYLQQPAFVNGKKIGKKDKPVALGRQKIYLFLNGVTGKENNVSYGLKKLANIVYGKALEQRYVYDDMQINEQEMMHNTERSAFQQLTQSFKTIAPVLNPSFRDRMGKARYSLNFGSTLTYMNNVLMAYREITTEAGFQNAESPAFQYINALQNDAGLTYAVGQRLFSSPLLRMYTNSNEGSNARLERNNFFHDKSNFFNNAKDFTSMTEIEELHSRLAAFARGNSPSTMGILAPTLGSRGYNFAVNLPRISFYKDMHQKQAYREDIEGMMKSILVRDLARMQAKYKRNDALIKEGNIDGLIEGTDYVKNKDGTYDHGSYLGFTKATFLTATDKGKVLAGKLISRYVISDNGHLDFTLQENAELFTEYKEIYEEHFEGETERLLKRMKKYKINEIDYKERGQAIDETIIRPLPLYAYKDKDSTIDGQKRLLAKDYVYANFIIQSSMREVFGGDLSLYGRGELGTFIKRTESLSTPGSTLISMNDFSDSRLGDSQKEGTSLVDLEDFKAAMSESFKNRMSEYKPFFTTAIIRDQFASDTSLAHLNKVANLADTMGDSIAKKFANILREKYIKNPATKTDGQAFVTMKYYRAMARQIRQWDENTHEKAYQNYLQGKKFAVYKTNEDGQEEIAFVPILAPLKSFHDGVYSHENAEVTEAVRPLIKHSAIPLLKDFTMMVPELENLRQRMELEGIYANDPNLVAIDEVNFESGVKTSRMNIFEHEQHINQVEGMHENATIDFRGMKHYPVRLSNANKRFPQVVPTREKMMKLGSQISKIIMDGYSENNWSKPVYLPDGTKVTAKDILDKYTNALTAKIIRNVRDFKGKLGLDPDQSFQDFDPATSRKFMTRLRNMLLNIAETRDLPENYRKILDIEEKNGRFYFKTPIHSPAFALKMQQVVLAMARKGMLQNFTPGKEFVQMAEFGDSLAADDSLKYINVNEKTGELEPAEIAIPYSMAVELGIKFDEQGNVIEINDKAKELTRMMGYRIPTQERASLIPLKIAKVLPKSYGKVVMVPPEITTQMGSDFDIDKLYIMMPRVTKAVRTSSFVEESNSAWNYDGKSKGAVIKSMITDEMENDVLVSMQERMSGEQLKGEQKVKIIKEMKEAFSIVTPTMIDDYDLNSYNTSAFIDYLYEENIVSENVIPLEVMESIVSNAIQSYRSLVNQGILKEGITSAETGIYGDPLTGKESTQVIDQTLFDAMYAMSVAPHVKASAINPMDNKTLHALKEFSQVQVGTGQFQRNLWSYDHDAEENAANQNKQAGFLIGIYATTSTGVSSGQHVGLSVAEDKTGYGTLSNVSLHISAGVDASKDPLEHFVNDSSFNSNVTIGTAISGEAYSSLGETLNSLAPLRNGKSLTGKSIEVAYVLRMQPLVLIMEEYIRINELGFKVNMDPNLLREFALEALAEYAEEENIEIDHDAIRNKRLERNEKIKEEGDDYSLKNEESLVNRGAKLIGKELKSMNEKDLADQMDLLNKYISAYHRGQHFRELSKYFLNNDVIKDKFKSVSSLFDYYNNIGKTAYKMDLDLEIGRPEMFYKIKNVLEQRKKEIIEDYMSPEDAIKEFNKQLKSEKGFVTGGLNDIFKRFPKEVDIYLQRIKDKELRVLKSTGEVVISIEKESSAEEFFKERKTHQPYQHKIDEVIDGELMPLVAKLFPEADPELMDLYGDVKENILFAKQMFIKPYVLANGENSPIKNMFRRNSYDKLLNRKNADGTTNEDNIANLLQKAKDFIRENNMTDLMKYQLFAVLEEKSKTRNIAFLEKTGIVMMNLGETSKPIKDKMTQEFQNLLESPHEELSNFAEALAKYAIINDGLQNSQTKFSDIIPADYYSYTTGLSKGSMRIALNEYMSGDYATDMIQIAKESKEEFEEAFIRNHYDLKGLVKSASTKRLTPLEKGAMTRETVIFDRSELNNESISSAELFQAMDNKVFVYNEEVTQYKNKRKNEAERSFEFGEQRQADGVPVTKIIKHNNAFVLTPTEFEKLNPPKFLRRFNKELKYYELLQRLPFKKVDSNGDPVRFYYSKFKVEFIVKHNETPKTIIEPAALGSNSKNMTIYSDSHEARDAHAKEQNC